MSSLNGLELESKINIDLVAISPAKSNTSFMDFVLFSHMISISFSLQSMSKSLSVCV